MEFKPFRVGKYTFLDRIASGGMAEVYLAKSKGAGGFEKQLAIKRILPNYGNDLSFQKMFESEAKLSSRLSHPNIAEVIDFVRIGGMYLLVMEYIAGKDLLKIFQVAEKRGRMLPVPFCLYVMRGVCHGLDHAHNLRDEQTGLPLGLTHRDISPQNILISYEGNVKIVDFGIAKARDRAKGETGSGIIKGKFGYMAPELVDGRPADHRSDIFSLGVTLYEVLTGRRLFFLESEFATLNKIRECDIPPPSLYNPDIDPELEAILLKALEKHPEDRYQSAAEIAQEVHEYLNRTAPAFSSQNVSRVMHSLFWQDISLESNKQGQFKRLLSLSGIPEVSNPFGREVNDIFPSRFRKNFSEPKRVENNHLLALEDYPMLPSVLTPKRSKSSLLVGSVSLTTIALLIALGIGRIFPNRMETLPQGATPVGNSLAYVPRTISLGLERVARIAEAKSGCPILIRSDPPGAEVALLGRRLGLTPLSETFPCSGEANMFFRMPGFRPVQHSLKLHPRRREFYTQLAKLPEGTVEFTLSHNAKVYSNRRFITDALANTTLSYRIPADTPMRFVFVNNTLGLWASGEFIVGKDRLLRRNVRLDSRR